MDREVKSLNDNTKSVLLMTINWRKRHSLHICTSSTEPMLWYILFRRQYSRVLLVYFVHGKMFSECRVRCTSAFSLLT